MNSIFIILAIGIWIAPAARVSAKPRVNLRRCKDIIAQSMADKFIPVRLELSTTPYISTLVDEGVSPSAGIGHFPLDYGSDSPNNRDNIGAVENIVSWAGEGMSDRFGEQFNVEYRNVVARKYSNQSYYLEDKVQVGTNPEDEWARAGTMGLTIGREDGKNEIEKQIPMYDLVDEKDGHTWKDALDKIRDTAGKIFEARTYRLANGLPIVDMLSTRADLKAWLYTQIQFCTRDNIAARDLRTVFTFGNETSIRMYRKLGFEVLDAKDGFPPIYAYGRYWYAMAVTPNRLSRDHEGFHNAHKLDTPWQLPHTIVTKSGNRLRTVRDVYYNRHGEITSYTVADRVRLAPGVWIPAGMEVWTEDRGKTWAVRGLEGARPNSKAVFNGIVVDTIEPVYFNADGTVKMIRRTGSPKTTFSDLDLSLPFYSALGFGRGGRLSWAVWGDVGEGEFEIVPGVFAAVWGEMWVEHYKDRDVMYLSDVTRVGSRVLSKVEYEGRPVQVTRFRNSGRMKTEVLTRSAFNKAKTKFLRFFDDVGVKVLVFGEHRHDGAT